MRPNRVIRHPESVVVVATDGEDIVLVRQTRGGAVRPTLELPAGSLEPGEKPLEAAERELAEECGLAAGCWSVVGTFWLVPSYSTEFVHVFEASSLRAVRPHPDADEDIVVEHLPLTALPDGLSDAASLAAFALWSAAARRDAA